MTQEELWLKNLFLKIDNFSGVLGYNTTLLITTAFAIIW